MKICLISPQTPFLESVTSPPINLLYLNSYLKMDGYTDTKVIDLNIEKVENIPQADVYAITGTTPQFPYATDLLPRLKELNPDSKTIIGGPHATAEPTSCATFDKVIIGDGEIALLQCLDDFKNNIDKHIYTGKQITNIDSLPMPNRNDIDIKKYKYFIDDKLSTIALTSRGCWFSCHFCQKMNNVLQKEKGISSGITELPVRFHSTEYVLKELQHLMDCGCEGVDFQDNVFTARKDLLSLGPILKKMAWRCQIRADEKVKNVELLNRMGCMHILSGIESGSQKILDTANKKIDIKKVTGLIKEYKHLDIDFRALIIVGLPGETHETVSETIDFLRDIEPDSVGVGTFVPYPGTYIYKHMDQFDIKIEEGLEKDYKKWFFRTRKGEYNNCIIRTSGLTSREILDYRNKIDKEFNKFN